MTPPTSPRPASAADAPSAARSGAAGLLVLGGIGLACAAVCILIVGRWMPLGVAGQWTWDYRPAGAFRLEWVLLSGLGAAGLMVLFGVGWRLLDRKRRWTAPVLLVLLAGMGFFTQISIEQATPEGTVKWLWTNYWPGLSGYHSAAVSRPEPIAEFLSHYDRFLADLAGSIHGHGHLGTHPPGLFVLHKAVLALCREPVGLASPVVAWLPVDWHEQFHQLAALGRPVPLDQQAALFLASVAARVLAVLAVGPIYGLGAAVAGRRAGWLAAHLYLLAPSPVLFAPTWDTAFPVLAGLIVWAAWAGVRPGGWPWAGLAGLGASLGLFTSLAFVPVTALAALVALAAWWQQRASSDGCFGQLVRAAAAGGGGLVLPYLVLWLALGFDVLGTWATNLSYHAQFYREFKRSYWPWVGVNLLEFLLAAGVPTAGLLLVRLGASLLRLKPAEQPEVLLGPFLLVLLALDLSGRNLSEVARLWIFLIPFATIAAAPSATRLGPRSAGLAVGLLMLQFVGCLVFNVNLEVLYKATKPP